MGFLPNYVKHQAGEKCVFCSSGKDKGGKFILRKAEGRSFLGCTRFPECKATTAVSYTQVNKARGSRKNKPNPRAKKTNPRAKALWKEHYEATKFIKHL
jgi:ssDNA-binding Zn-finger/Zn-ribbon topoisomerase 1